MTTREKIDTSHEIRQWVGTGISTVVCLAYLGYIGKFLYPDLGSKVKEKAKIIKGKFKKDSKKM